MESKSNEGLVGLVWPSPEEYEKRKAVFKKATSKVALDDLNKDIFISDFSDEQKKFASELFASFLWGVQMVKDVVGYQGPVPELTVIPTNQFHMIGLGNPVDDSFSPEKFRFYFVRSSFEYLLKEATSGKNNPSTYRSKISNMTIREHFELAGVEEMAHFLFLTTKQSMGKPKLPVSVNDYSVHYHTSDIEQRALLWQVAYTKRYMPEYYNPNKSLLEQVVAKRGEYRARDVKS